VSRRLRLIGGLSLMLVGLLLTFSPGARAEDGAAIDEVGWWWSAQVSELVAVPAPPDVTTDQMLVEGHPDGASAIAAIAARLPEDQVNPILTLKAPSEVGAAEAILLACQAGSAWSYADAGYWQAKPSPDCTSSVQGVPDPEGGSWTFALGPLQFNNQINVVLVPAKVDGQPEGADGSTFRIVFDKPTGASIVTTAGTAPDAGGFVTPDDNLGYSFPDTPVDTGGVGVGTGVLDVPPVAPPAALPEQDTGRTATAPVVQAVTNPVAPIASTDDSSRFVGVLLILVGAAAAYQMTNQTMPPLHGLSRFGHRADREVTATVAVEDQMGGLGRFRRERRTAPSRLY
jgi:hypothetical protein